MNDLVCRGEAREDFADTVFAESSHSKFSGASAEFACGELFIDHGADFVVDIEKFEDAHTSAEAVAAAFFAADGAEDGCIDGSGGVEMESAEDFIGKFCGSFAMRAKFSDEALRENGADCGCDEEWLHTDVSETCDGGWCVIGVES